LNVVKAMNRKILYSILVLIVLVGVVYLSKPFKIPYNETLKKKSELTTPTISNQISQEIKNMQSPSIQIDKTKMYTAIIKTEKGTMKVELYADKTPITVNNFVYLAKQGFYNNTIFHRTIPNFMIQGGDPTGTGAGGPGYRFADEPFIGEYTRGTLAMANAGPDTNGSQFFIMHKNYALPKNYVIFGKVTQGLEVIDAIVSAPTRSEGEGSSPVNPVKIESIEILEQ
jgi:cyclophilin family peptidyl-prolyl cis-trans isomerase